VALTYSIITPVRDEADALPRLADAIRRQTHLPKQWVIVESGSRDRTRAVAVTLTREYDWARLLVVPEVGQLERGGPIVRSIHAGLASLEPEPDVVVSVDADVTMEADYFERLLEAFEREPGLGIASGSAWELSGGRWQQRFVTGGTVWGATRAYRWACLQSVLPLEERHGWDGIDQLKARARGWKTRTIVSLPFRHHRPEGLRDGSRWAHWRANGDTAHFMGYRPWYLLSRTLFQMRRDRSAIGLVVGYATAAARRSPRLEDAGARAILRDDQSLRKILRRRREARGVVERAEEKLDDPRTQASS
jgi:poly-beta-1,6-N-acetyl-D-glucosamine synthase